MNVLHINTADTGGAAIAAIRIHLGLLENGVNSSLLTLFKSKQGIPNHYVYNGPVKITKPEYPLLTLKNVIKEKIAGKYQKEITEYHRKNESEKKIKTPVILNGFSSFGLFSSPDSVYDITKTKEYREADIIHLHWVAEFLDYSSFFKGNKKPIVWTLHDANPYRGGFHHEDDEIRNSGTHKSIDDAYKKIKKLAISEHQKMIIVSPSYWLAEEAKKSGVFGSNSIITIRNGIDLSIFKQHDKQWAKSFFNIPADRPVFVFASNDIQDYRKGLDLLLPIIESERWQHATFILAGSYSSVFNQPNVLALGNISDQRLMSLVYSAGDFFLLTSRVDNLPNTMVESIACGTPVIGFPIGDSPSVLAEEGCGIVAGEVTSASFEEAMQIALDQSEKFDTVKMLNFSRENFDQKTQAELYMNEYKKLIC